jgi:hypothetical protein
MGAGTGAGAGIGKDSLLEKAKHGNIRSFGNVACHRDGSLASSYYDLYGLNQGILKGEVSLYC